MVPNQSRINLTLYICDFPAQVKTASEIFRKHFHADVCVSTKIFQVSLCEDTDEGGTNEVTEKDAQHSIHCPIGFWA